MSFLFLWGIVFLEILLMNTLIQTCLFVFTSVLPFVILGSPFLVTLYLLWLFWSFDGVQSAHRCTEMFWSVVVFDVLYFLGAGWCLYRIEDGWLRLCFGIVFAVVGVCTTSFFFNHLAKKTIVD